MRAVGWEAMVLNWFTCHDDVMTWNRFPHYWPFLRGIHRSPVDSPHKGPAIRSFRVYLLLQQRSYRWFKKPYALFDVTVMLLYLFREAYLNYEKREQRFDTAGVYRTTERMVIYFIQNFTCIPFKKNPITAPPLGHFKKVFSHKRLVC